MAMTYKGSGPLDAKYAHGGPEVTTRSRFMKTPDTFRTSLQRQDYDKTSPGGELSKTKGDGKSLKPIKPKA